MSDETGVEVYVRHSAGRGMLNFYVPVELQAALLEAVSELAKGASSASASVVTHLEVSVLPEWITDESVREQIERIKGVIHMRIPIGILNFQTSEP